MDVDILVAYSSKVVSRCLLFLPAVLHHIDSWEGITTKYETMLINIINSLNRLGFYSSKQYFACMAKATTYLFTNKKPLINRLCLYTAKTCQSSKKTPTRYN
ncbi:hypothetical protein XBO1_970021 [Xenorhabdus bovienii str. oregonense]|uniref:Uncharacterized protein n=1 Tax=Xenorhabdus bovienii str. oregonense TaxID=1398202 RepID=A0A077P189_XENBV|nr:hypothetical protein XBO1_970021 [Xenorhabdus bovienii str. oregonense]